MKEKLELYRDLPGYQNLSVANLFDSNFFYDAFSASQ